MGFFLMTLIPTNSTQSRSSAASDVYKRQEQLYPRIAALAEVAWSNRKSDYDHFLSRLIGVKERWRSLGIQIKD